MGLIVVGAIIGAISNGFTGLLIGAFIGYAISIVLRKSVSGGLRIAQSELIDSTFAVMGALCKADKVVSRDEINAVEQVFNMFNLHATNSANRQRLPLVAASRPISISMPQSTSLRASVVVAVHCYNFSCRCSAWRWPQMGALMTPNIRCCYVSHSDWASMTEMLHNSKRCCVPRAAAHRRKVACRPRTGSPMPMLRLA